MSESNTYAPGVYVKGDVERVANSASAAVALVFDGFKPQAAEVKETVSEPVAVPAPPAPRPSAPKPTDPAKDDK